MPGVAEQVTQFVGEHSKRRPAVQGQNLAAQGTGHSVVWTQRRAGGGKSGNHRLARREAEAGSTAAHHLPGDLNRRAAGRGQSAGQGSRIDGSELRQEPGRPGRPDLRMGKQQSEGPWRRRRRRHDPKGAQRDRRYHDRETIGITAGGSTQYPGAASPEPAGHAGPLPQSSNHFVGHWRKGLAEIYEAQIGACRQRFQLA